MEINTSTDDEIILSIKLPLNLPEVLKNFQAKILEAAMKKSKGNRTRAATHSA